MANSPPLAVRKAWPRLSETLQYGRSPDTCQRCGQLGDPESLERYEECDEWDKGTGVLVVVCSPCAKACIGPHPRLYKGVDKWKPLPGVMALCLGCGQRDGLECRSPALKRNGGSGLEIAFPEPEGPVHLNYGGGRGEFRYLYRGPASKCAGRTPA